MIDYFIGAIETSQPYEEAYKDLKIKHGELQTEVERLKADINSLSREFDAQHKLVASRYVAERLMVLGGEWDTKDKPKPPPLLEDGYGSVWVNYCYRCKDATLEIVRPGRVQCHKCGGK